MKYKQKKAVIFANIVLSSLAILFILAIGYLLYKSNLNQIPPNLKFLAISIAGLLFSIVCFFFNEDWKINIVIALCSTIIAAYSMESILYVKENYNIQKMQIDKKDKYELLMNMRTQGIDAWPLVMPFLLLQSIEINESLSEKDSLFPFGGISNKMTIVCNESGQYTVFQSDEHGFRNPKGLYKKDSIRAALVGDSFTLGQCVQSGEDIASQLRDMEISSLNLGNGGNGPVIELAVLKEYVEPLKPEIVLWIYFEGNDLAELKRERNHSFLMRYLEDGYSQNLLDRQDEIDAVLIKFVNSSLIKLLRIQRSAEKAVIQRLQVLKKTSIKNRQSIIKLWHIRKRLGLLNVINIKNQPEILELRNNTMQLSLFSEILATAYKRSSDWGGKFYFVYLPTKQRYLNDNYADNSWDREDVLATVHKLGIPLIDFHEVLKKHPEPLSHFPFIGSWHYNAAGYKLVSEQIARRIKKDGLILHSDR